MLGMRESHEDWLELGPDPIARGLGAPLPIASDGALGLIKAVEQRRPASDRQHCAVHRVRILLAKPPERERGRVRRAYRQALDEASDERDGKQRLEVLVDQLDKARYSAAARPTTSTRSSSTGATRPDTAAGGEARTCSKGRSARPSAAPS
jgi:transposase-like protein